MKINLEIIQKLYTIKKYPVYFLLIAVFIAGGFAYYFYNKASILKKDPEKLAREKTEAIISRVSKLMMLPEGEEPTVATVSDPDKLKDQPFFKNAKKNDRVLIYTKAQKAILYDPVANKIIEIAPISLGNKSGL